MRFSQDVAAFSALSLGGTGALVLVALKLVGLVSWSWPVVTSPLWAPIVFACALGALILVWLVVAASIEGMWRVMNERRTRRQFRRR